MSIKHKLSILFLNFSCGPFLNNEFFSFLNSAQQHHSTPVEAMPTPSQMRPCPDITNINSVIKLNASHAVALTECDQLEYLNLNRYGYAMIPAPHMLNLDLETSGLNVENEKCSMINLNRILFVFQVNYIN